MRKHFIRLGALIFALFLLGNHPAAAQQHRATRLGNPATRFATPLQTPDDFRNMLRSDALRTDVAFIAHESGFKGDMEDLRRAAATANILPLRIPVGTRLPAMSSREHGKPVLLRDVLWAGKEPIDAYEFYFASQGRRYRVVSPKACANFWVEDYGKELKPALALDCDAPEQVPLGRTVRVCLTVKNTGDDLEPSATVTLPLPTTAILASATDGGQAVGGNVVWSGLNLPAGSSKQLCATLQAPQLGSLDFSPTATGSRAAAADSHCQTRIVGVPAVLLEVIDLDDPVQVGSDETYEITVLNQGTATLTNVKLENTLEAGQEFISGTGTSAVTAQEHKITMATLPTLSPKQRATWRVVVKTLTAGDVRFSTQLTSDQFQEPVTETEATQQY